jgi:hypothetical protein
MSGQISKEGLQEVLKDFTWGIGSLPAIYPEPLPILTRYYCSKKRLPISP